MTCIVSTWRRSLWCVKCYCTSYPFYKHYLRFHVRFTSYPPLIQYLHSTGAISNTRYYRGGLTTVVLSNAVCCLEGVTHPMAGAEENKRTLRHLTKRLYFTLLQRIHCLGCVIQNISVARPAPHHILQGAVMSPLYNVFRIILVFKRQNTTKVSPGRWQLLLCDCEEVSSSSCSGWDIIT